MDSILFRTWLVGVQSLTSLQRSKLKQSLGDRPVADEDACAWIDQRAQQVLACPHCAAAHVQRWGRTSGVQRYRCCVCHRTFSALTGTPLSGLKRRDAWARYAQALIDGVSVRKAAQQAHIHRTTSFRWRHRMLEPLAQEQETELQGVVEADETYFRASYKGRRDLMRRARRRGGPVPQKERGTELIPVLVVEDRQGHHFDAVLEKADKPTMTCLLGQVLAPDAVLCTDGAAVYRAVSRRFAFVHRRINLSAGKRVCYRAFHIQHVNAYHSRLKNWMTHFNGVATRYLPHYLGWRRMLERFSTSLTPKLVLQHAMG